MIKFNLKNTSEAKLGDIEAQLNKTKDQLNNINNVYRSFDPFKDEKAVVSAIVDMPVTNAWLKCYELLVEFNISGNVHFDNASFPGTFILCVRHYMRGKPYDWYASSLLDVTENTISPLADSYQLYKNNKDKWLMNDHNNGDVLNLSNQLEWNSKLGGKIDLYTSDLGFDVSSDYSKEEVMHLPANIGQILSGLLTLKKGGSFITKQFTFFEKLTQDIMWLTSTFFDEFYVCKPMTSRSANSETYLVGKGFKGGVYLKHKYIIMLMDKITQFNNLNLKNEN